MKILPVQKNYSYYRNNQQSRNIAFEAKGIYAGSFDPVTIGHMDVIKRASNLFEELTVLVAKNPEKKGFLDVNKRVELIEQAVRSENIKNVKVKSSSGFTTAFAREEQADYMVRGLRDAKDFDGEIALYNINRKLDPEIDTIFIPTSPETSMVSSSVVRSIHNMGGDVSNFVPKCVSDFLKGTNKS